MMSLLDVVLAHSDPDYDPVARRERYLRERELKGERISSVVTDTSKFTPKKPLSTVATKTARPKTPSQLRSEREAKLEAKRAVIKSARGKIDTLRKNLKDLQTNLKEMKAEEKQREIAAKKKPTIAEKKKAAVSSKRSYERNKTKINAEKRQRSKSLSTRIVETEEKISTIKTQITSAISNLKKLETS